MNFPVSLTDWLPAAESDLRKHPCKGETATLFPARSNLQENRHDDITYQSIAKAFGLKLKLHEDAFERMKRLTKQRPNQPPFDWDVDSPARTARMRMVELPIDESRDLAAQVLFVRDDLWVPIAVVNGNVHILPGVPSLCEFPSRDGCYLP